MFCPNCGTELPDRSAFCSNCGVKIGVAQPQQSQQYQQQQAPVQKKPAYLKPALIIAGILILVFVIRPIIAKMLDDGTEVVYKPNQKPDSTTSVSVSQTQASAVVTKTAADYMTSELPRPGDFEWYYNRDTNETDLVPDGAVPIKDVFLISGGWKCLQIRRPATEPYTCYWNMDLQITGNTVSATQYWSGWLNEDGTFEDGSQGNSNKYAGNIDQLMVMDLKDVYGNVFTIIQWYEYEGKQYAIGSYNCVFPSDENDPVGLIAMYRP